MKQQARHIIEQHVFSMPSRYGELPIRLIVLVSGLPVPKLPKVSRGSSTTWTIFVRLRDSLASNIQIKRLTLKASWLLRLVYLWRNIRKVATYVLYLLT